MSQLVLVTGGGGFIGAHVVLALLEAGFRVRATVRETESEAVQFLRDLRASPEGSSGGNGDVELVAADLVASSAAEWAAVASGCDLCCHVASPFFVMPAGTDAALAEEKLYRPAREGTETVLQACVDSGTVRRVVVTSSMASMLSGRPELVEDIEDPENEWADEERCDPYSRSKLLAERAARDFVARDGVDLELVTIHPTYVMGPPLSARDATSFEVAKRMLLRQMPAVPDLNMGTADVRDVALAHVRALQVPEANGRRLTCWGHATNMRHVSEVYAREFGPFGYRVPTAHLPKFVMWGMSWFDDTIATVLPRVGKPGQMVNVSQTEELLGMKFRPEDEMLIDMGHAVIRTGVVKMTDAYRKWMESTEE
jgi:nucleoside-diphosphate-sugar epimerase